MSATRYQTALPRFRVMVCATARHLKRSARQGFQPVHEFCFCLFLPSRATRGFYLSAPTRNLVEDTGVEPATCALQMRRSPN